MSENPSQKNFAQKLAELEAITTWFESENVDLNEALAKFERGMILADELKRELQQTENRVEKIKQKFNAAGAAAASQDEVPEEPEPAAGDAPNLFE
jgi:exodeoxyribonuclease VII small subunit